MIALFNCNKLPFEIFKLLKVLKITQKFVYRTSKRFNEMNPIDDKPRRLRLRVTQINKAVQTVAERIRKNPLRKQK